jgi:hypothetical protein
LDRVIREISALIKAIPLRPLFAAIYAAVTAFQVFRPAAMNQINDQRRAYFRI